MRLLIYTALLAVFWIAPASAHEFILKPQFWHAYASGQKLPVSIVSSHVYMKSEELENAASVEASYKGKSISLTANEAFASYDGVVELGGPGAAVLRAHRKGQLWSKTTQGMKPGGRELPGVIEVRKYEKFCKTLLPVGGSSKGFDAAVGDPLEIVPLDDVLSAKAGDEVAVKVLYQGKPLACQLTASYDGYSDAPDTAAFVAETDGDGVARVRLHTPGLWMVRVQHMAAAQAKDHDTHVMRAILVFPVGK